MQLTHHPWCKCVKLVAKLDVGALTLAEGTLHLVPKAKGRHTSGDVTCQV
jgi:hypothetical protein